MRVLVVNRWDDEFSAYGDYVDHLRHEVCYVTVPTHLPWIPEEARHVTVLDGLDDEAEVVAAAQAVQEACGRFDLVLALSEFDLTTGARIREVCGVPGDDSSRVRRFRDKVTMKTVLADAGVRVPRFATVKSPADIGEFRRRVGGPVVVKPRAQTASKGCHIVHNSFELSEVLTELERSGHDDYEVEEYVDGPIWHVDGIVEADRFLFARASRYVNTCYEYSRGTPLGSAVQEGPVADAMLAFTLRCLTGLGLHRSAFHLEIIESASGPVFLEVAARVGGGEIAFVLRDVYGVDVIGDWIRLQLGERPQTIGVSSESREIAGYLQVPGPAGHRLLSRPSLAGTIEGLYGEDLLEPGHCFDGPSGGEELLGRFRYRAGTVADVESAINATLDAFVCVTEPVQRSCV
ncbi:MULTISPECIES: ATP-grasp domain-containing protein [Streptosporangium]|uniref:Acetyl-CoA carboxylase biotin carboxylase subunit family protein n=1 Tax=Streptosporangium jomthongense TaxID=1193683 RepID=A0ABV8EU43_9ACTN